MWGFLATLTTDRGDGSYPGKLWLLVLVLCSLWSAGLWLGSSLAPLNWNEQPIGYLLPQWITGSSSWKLTSENSRPDRSSTSNDSRIKSFDFAPSKKLYLPHDDKVAKPGGPGP